MPVKQTEPISRKVREREGHRREIIVVAERIFAEKGYHATTIEEIAKEAEFAVGTLYNLFKGKDELYARVIENFVQQFMADFEEKVVSEDNPEKAIGALIGLRLTHFDEHRDRYVAAITKIFERGTASGIFDQGDPLYLTLCLEGIINAFVAYWSRHDPIEPLDIRIGKIRREFLERIKLRLPPA